MQLLGITGAKGSGKGTVAQFVAEWANEHGLLAVDRGFADKLKWAMARIFWPDISMEDAVEWANEFKNHPEAVVIVGHTGNRVEAAEDGSQINPEEMITGRQLFQHGGTEMGRDIFGNDFWVDQILPVQAPYKQNFKSADIGTVSDLRFENEAARIKALGGMIWQVDRPEFKPDGHASEKPLRGEMVDTFIDNMGSFDTLQGKVDAACKELILPKLHEIGG